MTEYNNKIKENENDYYYNNLNNSNEEEKEEKEIKERKKTLKTYKFHMLHHNGLLNILKKNGINIDLVDNIFNKNESLFIELLKNNDQNTLKKTFSDFNFQNNKNILNKNGINPNAINILKIYYESYGKNNNNMLIKDINQLNKDKLKKDIKLNSDSKRIKRNSIFSINSNRINIKKRFSLESNKQNNNSLNNSISNKDEPKNNQKNIKKRRGSVQLLPTKVYLSIDEDNYNNNEQHIEETNESNSNVSQRYSEKNKYKNNIKNNTLFQSVSQNNNLQKPSKRSNSTLSHVSNYSNNFYVQNNFKNTLPIIKKYNKIFYINNNKKPRYNYKRNNSQPFIKGSVNFKKMLSRAYLDRISNNVENIYSTITPNYLAIEPKCIMKVTYKNKKYNVKKPTFKGMSADYTFDMDKIFFKYNNHIPPKTFEFHKMAGRGPCKETKLPSFMIGQYDRNSFVTFNEKNLKMNSYANGQLKESISSFNDKKSFNFKLNDEKSKNNYDKEAQVEFENLVKKIIEKGIVNNNESRTINENNGNNSNNTNNNNCENRIINSIPFRIQTMYRNFMSEYKRDNNQGIKVDGITFKSYKNFTKRQKICKEYNDF